MERKLSYLLLLVLTIIRINVIGQQINFENITFEHSPISDGTSQTSVNTIIQDKTGFIWLGTHDGLLRFDGYEYKVFKNELQNIYSLSNNQIMTLCVDARGRLWIGTLGGGINIFIPEKEIFLNARNSPQYIQNLRNNEIWRIVSDKQQNIWIGTSDGLFKAEVIENDNQFKIQFKEYSYKTSYDPNRHFWVRTIIQTKDERFYVGGLDGLFKFDPERNLIWHIPVPQMGYKMITTMWEEKPNVLWIGTIEDGVYRVEIDKNDQILKVDELKSPQNRLHMPLKRIEALYLDRFNNLWIASRNGLGRINVRTFEHKVYYHDPNDITSLSDNRLSSVLEDKNGIIWIGTESKGVNRFDLYQKKFTVLRSNPNIPNSLSDNFISVIHTNLPGKIWVGSDGGGIDLIQYADRQKFDITRMPWNNALLNKNILSVFHASNDKLWFGSTRNSVGSVNLKTRQITYIPVFGYVFSIYEDSKQNIWLGTWGSGLYKISPDGKMHNYRRAYNDSTSLSSDIIIALFEDDNHQLWVGTKGGGLNLMIENTHFLNSTRFLRFMNQYNDSSSLSHNDVYCIMQSSKGELWLGTGAGVNKMIVQHTAKGTKILFKAYSEKQGLPNNIVYGILEDRKGNLWMSTNLGLAKFDTNTEKFTNFDVHDGIQSNEFHMNAYCKDYYGRMYFGGINGLTVFDPDSIIPNPYLADVIFTAIKIQGKPVGINEEINGRILLTQSPAYTDEIVINYKDKEVTFEFSSTHYAIPEKNRFRYRLLGFNDNWQEVSYKHRSVTYTNLSQGKYVFQVMSSNNDGVWPTRASELRIRVLPPPWLSIWAFLIYAILFALAIFLFKKYTLIGVTRKHQLIIDSIEKSKIEEMTRMKIQFFTNVSHELRTPLTLINNPLLDLMNNKKVDSHVKNELSIIQRNVNRLLHLVNQLLDFRKIDAGELKLKMAPINIIELLSEVCASFEQYANSRGITFQFVHNDEEIILWLDREKIITVFFNLISNAFKYSPDNTTIMVELNKNTNDPENSFVEVNVTDEGIGIEAEHLPHIFDRFFQVSTGHLKGSSGTGIGLALSKEYIESHSGNIYVHSKPGVGSKFTVRLPLRKDKLTDYIEISSEQLSAYESQQINSNILSTLTASFETGTGNESGIIKKTLLIVEDNTDLLHYLANRFSSKYHVIVADNGTKGLQLAHEKNPDIIITDILMPDIDGITLCRKLKNDIRTSHIPIIILTAKTTEETNVEGLEAGADVFLQKPFNLDVLKAQVKSLLESREKVKISFSKNIILQPKELVATSLDERFMIKLMDVIERNIAKPDFGIKHLTDEMNMSHSVIFRKIKALTGSNVIEFIRSVRLKKAAQLLQKQKIPVSEVALMVGFNDAKYFSKCFIKEFGVSPRDYAKGVGNIKDETTEELF